MIFPAVNPERDPFVPSLAESRLPEPDVYTECYTIIEHQPSGDPEDYRLIADLVIDPLIDPPKPLEEFESEIWPSLSKEKRKALTAKVNSVVEDYVSWQDFVNRSILTPGARSVLVEEFPQQDLCDLAAQAIGAKIQEFVGTVSGDLRMFSDPTFAREQIDNAMPSATKLLREAWRTICDVHVEKHRPATEAELHRSWSKALFNGVSRRQLARHAGVTEESVWSAVKRHRKRREEFTWQLRQHFYISDLGT